MGTFLKNHQVIITLLLLIHALHISAFTIPSEAFDVKRSATSSRTTASVSIAPTRQIVRSSSQSKLQYAKSTAFPAENKYQRKHVSQKALLNPAVMKASISATAKLLSSIGLGALASPAGPKQLGNVLDSGAVSALSKLTYWLFQPCFLLCGVAGTLAATASNSGGLSTSTLALLPLASLVQISLGAVVSKIITTQRFNIRPTVLGIDIDDEESANDIRMCTTFANSGPLPLILADALFNGAVLSDVTACISFYLLLWSPMFWTFGKIVLGLGEDNNNGTDKENSALAKVISSLKVLATPPVIGSIAGMAIGSSACLRNAIMKPTSFFYPVYGAIRTFGVAYLPSAILVLAGSLVGKKETSASETQDDKTKLHARTIISIMCSRFILSPILALSTVRILTLLKLMPSNCPRTLSILTFTLLMEGCMPPAQNSVILLNLAGEKQRAAKMAKTLTVIYALSTVPVTLLLSGCLAKSGILSFI